MDLNSIVAFASKEIAIMSFSATAVCQCENETKLELTSESGFPTIAVEVVDSKQSNHGNDSVVRQIDSPTVGVEQKVNFVNDY